MTAPITSDKILSSTAQRATKTDRQSGAPQQSEQNTETNVEAGSSVDVSRANELLVQELSSADISTTLETPEQARAAVAALVSQLKDNPQQALGAFAGVGAERTSALLETANG